MITGHWDSETIKKVIRLFIGSLCFLCFATIIGLNLRAAQQLFFALAIIVLSALLMRNIWITLFIWWSCLLFALFRFEAGQVYIINIFYGSILYYMTKLAFEKKHIDFFIKIILWVLAINLLYGCLQVLGYDFVFNSWENLNILGTQVIKGSPNGFMGNSGVMAGLCCLSIPLVATRSRHSIWLALLLLIPIFVLRSSISLVGAVIVLMFVAWFRMNRNLWLTLLVGLILASIAFFMFFDMPGMERINAWKTTLNDINHHPLIGWGMDSFRKYTTTKPFVYVQGLDNTSLTRWDNPHNLILSLLFEFGIVSIILLGGYLRQMAVCFKRSIKDNNVIALAGFLIGFFIVSMAGFPIFLARMCVLIVPVFALFEVATNG